MGETPSYPEESPVGDPVGREPPEAGATPGDKKGDADRTRQIVTGAAIGIGSAALVAALLYANRTRKTGDRKG